MDNSAVILAYLDPGTGSLILQALIGGVVGSAIAIKMYWQRIIDYISSKKTSVKMPPKE